MSVKPLTVRKCVVSVCRFFSACDLSTPYLDARLLVGGRMGFSDVEMICEGGSFVREEKIGEILLAAHRRSLGEPISKILGFKEFYGRSFHVSSAVLDPRPDSECLIDHMLSAIDAQGERGGCILDMGTGSGALLLTLLCERPFLRGVGVDISQDALDVAAFNASRLGVEDRVEWKLSSWFSEISGVFDHIISNPPYIKTADIENLSREVREYDPFLALDGGEDGLSAYRILASQGRSFLRAGGAFVLEIDPALTSFVLTCFLEQGFSPYDGKKEAVFYDLSGRQRGLFLV